MLVQSWSSLTAVGQCRDPCAKVEQSIPNVEHEAGGNGHEVFDSCCSGGQSKEIAER